MSNFYLDKITELGRQNAELGRQNAELGKEIAVFRKSHLMAMQIHRMNRGVTVLEFVITIIKQLGADDLDPEFVLGLLEELGHTHGYAWCSDELHTRDEGDYGYRKNGIYEIIHEVFDYFSEYIEEELE